MQAQRAWSAHWHDRQQRQDRLHRLRQQQESLQWEDNRERFQNGPEGVQLWRLNACRLVGLHVLL